MYGKITCSLITAPRLCSVMAHFWLTSATLDVRLRACERGFSGDTSSHVFYMGCIKFNLMLLNNNNRSLRIPIETHHASLFVDTGLQLSVTVAQGLV